MEDVVFQNSFLDDLANWQGTEKWLEDLFPKAPEGHRSMRVRVEIPQHVYIGLGSIVVGSILIAKYL